MNTQERHDRIVYKLQNSKLSKDQRNILAAEQRKLALNLYIKAKKVKIIPEKSKKYQKNYTERVYVNKTFDKSQQHILDELINIRNSRVTQKFGKVSF